MIKIILLQGIPTATGTYMVMGHFLTLLVQNLFEDTVLFKIGPGQKSVQLFPIWTILP